jgi:hypothetical protein
MKLRIVLFLLLLFCRPGWAEFDLLPYQSIYLHQENASASFYYPPYFRETGSLSFLNILAELRFRFEFLAGLRPEPYYHNCFKMQKRIEKSLERMASAVKTLPFRRIDDELIFNEESPLAEYLRPVPRKTSPRCSYRSIGDISSGGAVFCEYHGPAEDSDFYQKNRQHFDAARPAFTAFEVVEIMFFLLTWFVMKKVLNRN